MDVLFLPSFGSICRGFLRFMQWYMKKYGVDVGKKKKGAQKEEKQDFFGGQTKLVDQV